MRIIALDVHRSFAQTAILENEKLRSAGKIDLERNCLLQFARKLKLDDEIVIEMTGGFILNLCCGLEWARSKPYLNLVEKKSRWPRGWACEFWARNSFMANK
jgi:hypothetical protein